MGNPSERFWVKVEKTKDCWNWKAGKNNSGYGSFKFNGIPMAAHRLAYELTRGQIPIGLEIDHLCSNRCCVNPDHMELVIHAVNLSRGILKKGRHICGICQERFPNFKKLRAHKFAIHSY